MAKSTGLGMTVAVDDSAGTVRTISNDVASVGISTPRPAFNITGVDKSAMERLQGLADMKVDFDLYFNPAASPSSHGTFSTVSSTSVARTTTLTLAAKVLAGELLYNDYNVNRAQSGEVKCKATGELADGTTPTWA